MYQRQGDSIHWHQGLLSMCAVVENMEWGQSSALCVGEEVGEICLLMYTCMCDCVENM